MDKSIGDEKRKYINKNKTDNTLRQIKKKNKKSSNHRNKDSLHKPVRNYVNSYLNHISNNKQLLDDFCFPLHSSDTYTYWDCKPYKPKVFIL